MSEMVIDSNTTPRVRAIAHYLPQFHEIPENDRWWGKGFTEWTNVRAARPLYFGHEQPRVPTTLGYYDLSDPEVRAAQAELAAAHGIEAFCYWHYWFAGRRLLEMPFREVLCCGEPNFPFCLAWANHDWSADWVGRPWEMLLEQTYPGREDFEGHFRAVQPAFEDPRYVMVDGCPLFLIYRPLRMPDVKAFTDCWRELALRAGFRGLFFVGVTHDSISAEPLGLDGTLELGIQHLNPALPVATRRLERGRMYLQRGLERARLARLHQALAHAGKRGAGGGLVGQALAPLHLPHRVAHTDLVSAFEHRRFIRDDRYPSVTPNWDNTPRRGRWGTVFEGSCPELFTRQLRHAARLLRERPEQRRLVFIKSWNEWAEGNYIEPDLHNGAGYLEALRDVVHGD